MKQKILVLREPAFLDPIHLIRDRSYPIFNKLFREFEVSNVFHMAQANEYFSTHRPDLIVLSLENFLIQKIGAFQKLRNLMKQTPILILSPELAREDRIEIHKIPNTFAFQLDAEEKDLENYLVHFRFRNAKGRSFLRYKRHRELKLYFNNQEIPAHFIDYSQTGAQLQLEGVSLPRKSQVLISYQSQSNDQLRQIDSYVVWSEENRRVGIQFLGVR